MGNNDDEHAAEGRDGHHDHDVGAACKKGGEKGWSDILIFG